MLFESYETRFFSLYSRRVVTLWLKSTKVWVLRPSIPTITPVTSWPVSEYRLHITYINTLRVHYIEIGSRMPLFPLGVTGFLNYFNDFTT